MLGDILIGILGNTAYDTLKKIFNKHFGEEEDHIFKAFIQSIKSTSSEFFKVNGDTYGTIQSSFLSIEQNWDVILRSIFYGTGEIDECCFVLNGLGINKRDASSGARRFVEMLNAEMRKNRHLDKVLAEKKHIIDTGRHIKETEQKLDSLFQKMESNKFVHSIFPTTLIDQKIKDELDEICKSRFFAEFNTVGASISLARKIIDGELSNGTSSERSRALSWCARFISSSEEVLKASEFLEIAKSLEYRIEIDITQALINYSNTGDKYAALSSLAGIDTPISRSACLFVILQHDGAEGGITWFETVGFKAENLDPYGKHLLLAQCLKLYKSDIAEQTLETLTAEDFDECPILYHLCGLYYLQSTVPVELFPIVINQAPFQAHDFPLASEAASIHSRRLARRYFADAATIAYQLKCFHAAAIDDEYALWLELRDPEDSDQGVKRLESKLRDSKSSLHLVHLALQFKIKLELKTVEQEIERQIALHGGITQEAAIARFSLVLTKKSPDEAASYISRHYSELSKFYDKKSLLYLQIDFCLQAGLRERANENLSELIEEGITVDEEKRIRKLINDVENVDPIEYRKIKFEQSRSLNDLIPLVDELEFRGEWISLCLYGELLFERTRSIQDAERLAKALLNTKETFKLVELIKAHIDFLDQSINLRMLYSWALYYEGYLLESRSELLKLSDDQQDRNYRLLQVNLGISLGDWHSLSVFIINEIQEKNNRSPHELISAAQLAIQLNLQPYAKELIHTAIAVANNDANVYISAYFLATNAGWENDPEISLWLQKATEFSDDDGPLQKMSLKEIMENKPEWDRHESETWTSLSNGDIPQILAAHSLNKSLVGLMVFPSYANLSKTDLRYKDIIPAYSGTRQPNRIDEVEVIGIEATALITLSFLNILENTFEAFNEVHIPHSTLRWLFEEKQKISYHQPSRIIQAKKLRNMIATDLLNKLVTKINPCSELSDRIGNDLANLITEAEKVRQDSDTQCFVITPYPVHRIGSLMEEEADLSEYSSIMNSCLSVVESLRKKGQITGEELQRARAYLNIIEKPWPSELEINDNAILYLDDLAVNYLQHLGLLEKLKNAGFKAFVSPRTLSIANELISFEGISSNVEELVERIRYTISTQIESGKIKVDRLQKFEELDYDSISEHPTVSVIALASKCNVIISDDRFLNKHEHIEYNGVQTQISSTLDIINALVSKGLITSNNRLEYRTKLRRAGYVFIPVDDYELTTHLEDSSVINGKVFETAELKAIRESILSVRMWNWLQLPKEALWLNSIFDVYHRVLKNFWRDEADLSTVIAYSDWILGQLDIRGWAHKYEDGNYLVNAGRGIFILLLLSPPPNVQNAIKVEFWNWITDNVLTPLREQFHDLFDAIVEWNKRQIIDISENEQFSQIGNGENALLVRSMIVQLALNQLPPIMRESILEDKPFRESYGISVDAVLSLNGSDISFQQSTLFCAIRDITLLSPNKEIIDNQDRVWKLKYQINGKLKPVLVISNDKQQFSLSDFLPLVGDSALRLRSLDKVSADVSFPVEDKNRWNGILTNRALEDDEIDEFHTDITDTPGFKERTIYQGLTSGNASTSLLIPSSKRYYERLVGCYDGSLSIREYATGQGRQHFEQLLHLNPYEGLLHCLYVSLHSDLTYEIKMENIDINVIVRVFEFLESNGDVVSQIGAIEIGLRILSSKPEISPLIIRLIKQIRDDRVDGSLSKIKLFSALFILIDGELSRIRLFSSEPPFYRRLASMSHAALIHRQLIKSGVNIDLFSDWALNICGEQFYFQSLTDIRLEPRWSPDFALPSQIKAEFLGRILSAAQKNETNITDQELHELVLGMKAQSLRSLIEFQWYFPGPLEGVYDIPPQLPQELLDTIESQLQSEEISSISFIGLINSAFIFRVETTHVELVARNLQLGNHRLNNVSDKTQLLAILNGLASVAAVARSSLLAKEIKELVRVYRHHPQYSLTITETLRVCLVAAACYEDLNNWNEFIGEWLTELAFSKLDNDEVNVFLSQLQCLCHAVPELWVTCGRAEAALRALSTN
ncbi:hypothetical protein [Paenibacillus sp. NAIST15-1]|uniref:HTH domain-containing protein n=1 Tax=Paenibacillus sp. NAIST15-1 TaxID=1605994 RepID=UPI00086BD285|nr:hypothetical protein [Paenibacillus sp. NAIST15-1]GAV12970.1 hypothetical protein PBN151_2903 [Paenibacillus sp. NAIST15-1]